jgi:hypothetical protein
MQVKTSIEPIKKTDVEENLQLERTRVSGGTTSRHEEEV